MNYVSLGISTNFSSMLCELVLMNSEEVDVRHKT